VGFASSFEAEVHVVHVSDHKGMEANIKFRGFCDLVQEHIKYPKLHFKHIKAERFSQGISQFLDEYPASLITITRYKKAFLRTVLWANKAQELTYHTTVPMLVQMPVPLPNG
jgi:hypothetical protein